MENKKRSILLISNLYPSKVNPTYGIFVKNVESQLVKQGFVISGKVVIDFPNGTLIQKVIKYLKFYFKVIVTVAFKRFDYIYVHHISFCSIPLLLSIWFSSAKLILNAHGNDVIATSLVKKLLILPASILAKCADLIVVPSNYFKTETIKTYSVQKRKIFVYPSGGIDGKIFYPIDRVSAKIKYSFESDSFVMGYVSRIDKGKGWDVFLEAVNILVKKNPIIKAIVVGWGEEIKQFEEKIKELKLQNTITYIRSIQHTDLNYVYNTMDLFVFPTLLKESLGLVGLEAMAAGIPVIATQIGGITDYLTSGKNGFFFQKGDFAQIASIVEEYMGYSEFQKDELAKNSIFTAQNYDTVLTNKALADKFLQLYIEKN